MRKCTNSTLGSYFVPATIPGPKPGDFPIGSLQSRAAARAILTGYADEQRKKKEAEIGNLTPVEEALIEDVDIPPVQILIIRLFRVAKEREKVYGRELAFFTPEEIRHKRAVARDIESG